MLVISINPLKMTGSISPKIVLMFIVRIRNVKNIAECVIEMGKIMLIVRAFSFS